MRKWAPGQALHLVSKPLPLAELEVEDDGLGVPPFIRHVPFGVKGPVRIGAPRSAVQSC
ncbi:hypothetical protein MPLDJ20_260047 [Mesorhizobium plurifarium]|uniref:Uncharacterized protein n=1 Tax=Mesorhizobium plurifarium TaxID=69974 RepID=A0A090FD32_MESPL|nr:hypothetical protein MPLDJ20_260047 [Mesorhizobium plurifarium]